MANKIKKEKLANAFKVLEKQYGEGSIFSLGSKKSIVKINRWSTGLTDLDAIIGGGMPAGRIIEVYGPKSSGKTSLAYHLLAQHEHAIHIPIEGTWDQERARVFGCQEGRLFLRRANVGEECLEMIQIAAEAGIPFVVIDSVPAMITRREFEEDDYEKEGQRGRIAALLSSKLPKISVICEQSRTTLLFINQVRDNMAAFAFGETTHTPGGRALEHFDSIKISVNRVEWIKIPNKDVFNSAKDKMIGQKMKLKITKSKVCPPLGECRLAMIFDRGFVPMEEVDNIRKEIMSENRKKGKEKKDG